MPDGLDAGNAANASKDPEVERKITAVCAALIAAEDELNALDAKVGDGDTGTTFAGAARAVRDHLAELPLAEPSALCEALSRRLSRAVGGSSGVLMSIFFAATGAALGENKGWVPALKRGIERLQFHGGAQAGDRTLLDALIPAVEALKTGRLTEAATAARQGAEATADMTRAGTGRSSYLGEGSLKGYPDPGAVAVAKAFEALAG